jgi:hypothetical protein
MNIRLTFGDEHGGTFNGKLGLIDKKQILIFILIVNIRRVLT